MPDLQASVEQFYEDRPAPAEVHLPGPPEDCELLEAWLSERSGRRVQVLVPKRGEKRGLVELANRNARVAYQARLIDTGLSQYDALETLRAVLALPAIPRRVECFDISTIQGSETVASMVVCEDGRMRKSDYRKYRISPANHAGSDDFAAMHEVVQRRYRKLLEQGGPFPDLILIDGGKGQLTAAYDALRELGLANLIAVGIAKKEELIYTRDRDQPIAFAKDDPALRLLDLFESRKPLGCFPDSVEEADPFRVGDLLAEPLAEYVLLEFDVQPGEPDAVAVARSRGGCARRRLGRFGRGGRSR